MMTKAALIAMLAAVFLFESEHTALQPMIAALSSDAEHRTARYSSHVFNDYDPWIVIQEIELLGKRLPEKSRRR